MLHRLESRTRLQIITPCDGRRWWDANLHAPTCESPSLLLCSTTTYANHGLVLDLVICKLKECDDIYDAERPY